MPLDGLVTQLNRSNCVGLMLAAFRSNAVVKALIFMPGATDEFYMFRRAEAVLTNASPTLLDAVIALSNQTLIRATFRDPFLLLHTEEDSLEPEVVVRRAATVEKLRKTLVPSHLAFEDGDWDALQPVLKWAIRMDLRPWRYSRDSWHFYRHSFAGWNLSGWEALQAAALAGKTRFTVHRGRVVFEPDPRVRGAPGRNASVLGGGGAAPDR